MLAMHRMFLADDLVALIVVTVYPLDPHSSGACDENLLGRCL
jgi:hypothetical protein